jgi:hypothetical protein
VRHLCIGLLVFLPTVSFADSLVVLTQPPPLASDADALPRLDASDEVSRKINAQLETADRNALDERAMCLAAGTLSDWSRSTDVTFAGPDYLGLEVLVGGYCDGAAHPYNYHQVLTFDLATGEALDWQQALPDAFHAVKTGHGLPRSPQLSALFILAASPIVPDCEDVLTSKPMSFSLWLDGERHAIAISPTSLAYVDTHCIDVVWLTVAQAQTLGADVRLIAAITNANLITNPSP